ncbi:GerAB/ArcD/ProY family transporter [Clostridium grantii]|uniref:Spore germination protein KB n=1 Tax=Clostridium grantii DSM 8605 TaxID=1121316 RepID=A0A1M5VF32_9CLOT|nr:endospore germination permease [Clostridium grantii]SHH73836.1 spore germination protein KB [Clostridium grantii DSM 8605]
MNKTILTEKQGICIVIMFILSNAILGVRGIQAKEDFWVALILTIAITIFMSFILSKLYYTYPNKDLFDIIEICFGRFIGKIFITLYVYFLLEEGTMVLMNFAYFTNLTYLDRTPLLVIKMFFLLLCLYTSKLGIYILGRCSEYFLIWVIPIIGFSIAFSIPDMDFNNIRPFFNTGVRPIMMGVLYAYTFPFGEIVTLSAVLSNLKERNSAYKIYISGTLISGLILLLTSSTNILVLGVKVASSTFYPTYITMSKIQIGDAIQRIEIIMTLVYILSALIKTSVYLLATCKAIIKLFDFHDHSFLLTPTAFLMLNLSIFLTPNILAYWEYNDKFWTYWSLFFLFIFPVILLIVSSIKEYKKIKFL